MVEQPYFNEPGYETTMGTPDGDQKSQAYNKSEIFFLLLKCLFLKQHCFNIAGIRKDCIQLAMVEMLNSPPPAFENVVKCHFKLKKTRVLEVLLHVCTFCNYF